MGLAIALTAAVAAAGSAALAAGGSAALDPGQPYAGEISNPVTYNVSFDLVFTPRYHAERARVWMVKPQILPGQVVEEYQVSPAPASVAPDPLYGNTLLCVQYDKPNGAQVIRQRYRLTCSEMRWNIDPAKILNVAEYPASFRPFLRGEQSVVVNDRIRALARKVAVGARDPYEKARRVMLYVMETLTYGHDLCSLRASSLLALDRRHGHCSDYHGLCTALLRAVGVPARVAYGINPLDAKKASPSHCKLEVYLAPYGWVNFDVSETDKALTRLDADRSKPAAEKDALRKRFLDRRVGGFKDNTWYRMAAGTDNPLVPAPKAANPPLIRTAYIEVDGEPLPDPDPGNPANILFAWHLLCDWSPDRQVSLPW